MRLVDRTTRRKPITSENHLDDGGFIMVALLIGIAVSAIWMGALLPEWAQQETREREAELIFRGEQYSRAIYLYRQKYQTPPPDIETLVSQKFLRKKYLDPMTGKDFLPVAGVTAGQNGGRGATPAQPLQAGLTGVRSTSNEPSIVIYQNQQTYSQFPFDWTAEALRSGGGAAGGARGGQGGRGADGRTQGPGGRNGAPNGQRGGVPQGVPADGSNPAGNRGRGAGGQAPAAPGRGGIGGGGGGGFGGGGR